MPIVKTVVALSVVLLLLAPKNNAKRASEPPFNQLLFTSVILLLFNQLAVFEVYVETMKWGLKIYEGPHGD